MSPLSLIVVSCFLELRPILYIHGHEEADQPVRAQAVLVLRCPHGPGLWIVFTRRVLDEMIDSQ